MDFAFSFCPHLLCQSKSWEYFKHNCGFIFSNFLLDFQDKFANVMIKSIKKKNDLLNKYWWEIGNGPFFMLFETFTWCLVFNHHVIWSPRNWGVTFIQDSSMWATGIGLQITYKTCPPYLVQYLWSFKFKY